MRETDRHGGGGVGGRQKEYLGRGEQREGRRKEKEEKGGPI